MAHNKSRVVPKLLKELETTPIMSIACKKAGIGRATAYRWIEDDEDFANAARLAMERGIDLINDLAESQLIRGVNDDKQSYVFFWLRNNHTKYGPQSVRQHRAKSIWERQPMRSLVQFIGRDAGED